MGTTIIHAGSSGFAYREWRGSFYPAALPAGKMLAYYAARLPAVEVNASFYRMPAVRQMEAWRAEVPEGFLFALKAPGVITHRKKLQDASEETAAFLAVVSHLGPNLGPLLFQLPPFLPFDPHLLQEFLPLLAGVRAALEFRHPSWFREETYSLLAAAGVALCSSDREGLPEPALVPTAPFGYVRLRRNSYEQPRLESWRKTVSSLGWEEVFVFFRHEETAAAPRLAALLMGAVAGR